VLDDPIAKNSALGEFTHYANVLDLTGISVPAGTFPVSELAKAPSYVDQTQMSPPDADSGKESEEDEQQRLPYGVTLLGGSRTDAEVLEIARRFEEAVKAKK
jgi:Asp-tRNA(Asn)/Glu-tRNA(Gln) amidotransferase A subunit family amidase